MRFAFEDYVLDVNRRELRRGDQLVALEPQVFDVLVYLVQNRDRVVSKDDLLAAVWNSRIRSDAVLSSRIASVRRAIDDSGDQQRLIRTVSRKGFRFVGPVSPAPAAEVDVSAGAPGAASADAASGLALPEKPSIAVLPFRNMGGDVEQEYFADGIVEEIITSLSRVGWLFVIARNSSFTYKGRSADVRQVGRDLGVRYVLEGSVRKASDRVRITGRLIDASTGAHLWADRFDGTLGDIFDLQDQVTACVVGAITPKVEQAEIERSKRKQTENLGAYDLFLRGMAAVHQANREANAEALHLFRQAIEFDPEYAAAYAMAAYCYVWRKTSGWMVDTSSEAAEADRFARRAVASGRADAVALARGGQALAYVVGDLEDGATLIDRSLSLNPNLALGWYASGWVRAYLGEPEVAIEHLTRAMRLSPVDPEISRMKAGIATAHLIAGRVEDARTWAQDALRDQPSYVTAVRLVAASSAMAGRHGDARKAVDVLRRLDPDLCVSKLKDRLPFRRTEDLARYQEGLRLAGIRE